MDKSKHAYPSSSTNYRSAQPGMTLREYYAGLAMAALISSENFNGEIGTAANDAVMAADALINRLEEKWEGDFVPDDPKGADREIEPLDP